MSLATGLVRLRLVCDFSNKVCIGKQMCVRDLRIRLINYNRKMSYLFVC